MRIQQAFFTLLRAGLWERQPDDRAYCPLSDGEWQTVYRKAKQHAVEGILFDAFGHLDTAFFPPRQLLLTWCAQVEQTERRYAWMNGLIAEQAAFFSEQNLRPLLLKGQGLAQCYRHPEHRVCGDIDWYFPTKDLLPFESDGDDTCEWMLREIWEGGDFGFHDNAHPLYPWVGSSNGKTGLKKFGGISVCISCMPPWRHFFFRWYRCIPDGRTRKSRGDTLS